VTSYAYMFAGEREGSIKVPEARSTYGALIYMHSYGMKDRMNINGKDITGWRR